MTDNSQNQPTQPADGWLSLDDEQLLRQCRVETYKASGPGGQHRNKVSSAVRLRHNPTGVTAHGDDSRSQHENKRLALKRLRMEIAINLRGDFTLGSGDIPAIISKCLSRPKQPTAKARLDIGRKDARFWPLIQAMLDVLDAAEGNLAKAAAAIGIGSSNFAAQIKKDRHSYAAASSVRKKYNLGAIN